MIRKNIEIIRRTIEDVSFRCGRDPSTIKLVAVSKRFPPEAIQEARQAGQLLFGENYLQEAREKKAVLGDSVRFHFIGHLQSNKARTAAELFDMVETVDRFKIAAALNRHLLTLGKTMDILVQVNIGEDPKKSGSLPADAPRLIGDIQELSQLRIRGLMTMPPFTQDPEASRGSFRDLRLLSENLQDRGLLPTDGPIELSMGMSNDYPVAIEEGATMIRVGTAIFGHRPPPPQTP